MRGQEENRGFMFTYLSSEQRVPEDHRLRMMKAFADAFLKEMNPTFKVMYSNTGRPSIPPERLLKAQFLIALFTVRADRMFCEQLDYNILFRWFLDMNLEEPSFDATSFTKNRERLLAHAVSLKFFDAVVRQARKQDLLSDDHFTVDGTLIDAWASMKSFQPIEPSQDSGKPPQDGGSNPNADFRGERCSNKAHRSRTDPEARLMRKGLGKEARLSFLGHALMENKNGWCIDLKVNKATGYAEREAALDMLSRQVRKRVHPKTLGADRGYHASDFVDGLRSMNMTPHIAQAKNRNTSGLDGRTTRHAGYAVSQRIRKRVEEIFGWFKTVGGLRKTRFRGVERTQEYVFMLGAAYNLLRMSQLVPTGGGT